MRMRLRALGFALLIFTLPGRLAAAAGEAGPAGEPSSGKSSRPLRAGGPTEQTFTGTIGTYSVRMRLRRDGNSLDGEYFYEKYLRRIFIHGEIRDDGKVRLGEGGGGGKPGAVFSGILADSGRLEGLWEKEGSLTTLPFVLDPFRPKARSGASPDLSKLPATTDVTVDLDYDTAGSEEWTQNQRVFTDPSTKETFLLLPVDIPFQARTGYSLFQARGSHWYGGTLITLKPSSEQYTLRQVGLKLSDPAGVERLSMEVAAEYSTQPPGTPRGCLAPQRSEGFLSRLLQIFSSDAYACGAGIYLHSVGSSSLLPIGTTGGTQWYELDLPIPLSDISTGYCSDIEDARYWADDYEMSQAQAEEWCAQWKYRAIRMHIEYRPVRAGKLIAQVDAIVLDAKSGRQARATLAPKKDAYRAYFVAFEKGRVEFAYESATTSVDMRVINDGSQAISLDDYLLGLLGRHLGWDRNAAAGFSLYNVDGQRVDSVSLEKTLVGLQGKIVPPRSSIQIPLFSLAALPAGQLYFPLIDYKPPAPPEVTAAGEPPRLVDWRLEIAGHPFDPVDGGKRYFLPIHSRQGTYGPAVLYKDEASEIVVSGLVERQGDFDSLGVLCRQLLPEPKSWIYEPTVPEESYHYHRTAPGPSAIMEWGLLLPKRGAEYLAGLQGVTGIAPGRDYYGNAITGYRRAGRTGFIVDRDLPCHSSAGICSRSILYEVPDSWTADRKRMAHLLWLIRTNVVYH
jgi:hypothetical protein